MMHRVVFLIFFVSLKLFPVMTKLKESNNMEKQTGLRGCSRLSNLIVSPPGVDIYKPIVRKMNKHVGDKMRAAIRMCSREPVTADSLTRAVAETVAAMAAKCPPPNRVYSQPQILKAVEEEGSLFVQTKSRNGLPNVFEPCLYRTRRPPKTLTVVQRRALVSAAVPLIIAAAIDDGRLPPFNP